MKISLLLISLLFEIVGCTRELITTTEKQQMFFQAEYVNYAWGYVHQGIIIDTAGRKWTYKLPANWNYADSTGYISADKMNANFGKLTSTSVVISKETLQKYYAQLNLAAIGELTKPAMVMADAGVTTYAGYIFNPKTNKYKRVLIKQVGDILIENKSTAAADIYAWLNKIYLDN